jgi:hypothetical protein
MMSLWVGDSATRRFRFPAFFGGQREPPCCRRAIGCAGVVGGCISGISETMFYLRLLCVSFLFLKVNDDAPWKRSFQFRPSAIAVFGAYGDGATAILQQLAQKHSKHTCMTVGACKLLAFKFLSVALQTVNARMLRSRKALVAPLSLLPQPPGAAS